MTNPIYTQATLEKFGLNHLKTISKICGYSVVGDKRKKSSYIEAILNQQAAPIDEQGSGRMSPVLWRGERSGLIDGREFSISPVNGAVIMVINNALAIDPPAYRDRIQEALKSRLPEHYLGD